MSLIQKCKDNLERYGTIAAILDFQYRSSHAGISIDNLQRT
jgi:hypothetical protein